MSDRKPRNLSGIPNMPSGDVKPRNLGDDSYTSRESFKAFYQRGRYIGANEGYGASISDTDRLFYSTREPVGVWWVKGIAQDLWDNWFRVVDESDEDSPELDNKIQKVLRQLKASQQLPRETAFERRYGTSILLCSYTGFGEETNWETPLFELDSDGKPPKTLDSGKKLLQITPYQWTRVNVDTLDDNPNSIRCGLPLYYEINTGSGKGDSTNPTGIEKDKIIKAHWTRVIHDAPRLDEHTYEGVAAIDVIFDDLVGGRNARWGAYEGYYRHGTGFPVIKTNATAEQNQDWINAGGLDDFLNVRGYFMCKTDEDFQFVGAQAATLDPNTYFDMYFTFIAAGTGVAKDSISGVSAGRVTGSESNERKYFKAISLHQNQKEPMLRELIDRIIQTRQVVFDGEYRIDWVDPFEVNPQDKASIEFLQERTNALRLQTETIDEVRARKALDPLPDGKGEELLPQPGQQNPTTAGAANQETPSRQATTPEAPEEDDESLFNRIKNDFMSLMSRN